MLFTLLKEVLFEYERQCFCRINIYTAFYVFQVWAKLIFHFPLQLNRCPQFHTIKGLKSPLLKGGNDAKLCLIQLRCNWTCREKHPITASFEVPELFSSFDLWRRYNKAISKLPEQTNNLSFCECLHLWCTKAIASSELGGHSCLYFFSCYRQTNISRNKNMFKDSITGIYEIRTTNYWFK